MSEPSSEDPARGRAGNVAAEGIAGYPQLCLKGRNDGFRFPAPKQFHVAPSDDERLDFLHLPKIGMNHPGFAGGR